MKITLSVAVVTLSSIVHPALAMDYSWRTFRDQVVIDASGEINADEDKHFIAWVQQNHRNWNGRKATAIVFDSPGGSVAGAIGMGLIVNSFHMITGVAHGGECASACVMVWSVGTVKSAGTDSRIGVHMASELDRSVTVEGTMLNIEWLQKAKAPKSVVVGAMSTKPDDIYWLSQEELIAWNVRMVPAEAKPSTNVKCSDITDSKERLACYDNKPEDKLGNDKQILERTFDGTCTKMNVDDNDVTCSQSFTIAIDGADSKFIALRTNYKIAESYSSPSTIDVTFTSRKSFRQSNNSLDLIIEEVTLSRASKKSVSSVSSGRCNLLKIDKKMYIDCDVVTAILDRKSSLRFQWTASGNERASPE